MLSIDPVRLARRQLDLDREATARFAPLLVTRIARTTASPLALLRGSAPLFYELLRHDPRLSEGPDGEGWLVGDAHVENFGAFRAQSSSSGEHTRALDDERVVFDLNDFDEAFIGPWRFDVLRLATSLVLGGRAMGVDGPRTLSMCDALVEAYVAAVFQRDAGSPPPVVVTRLVDAVRMRTRKELLDRRTKIVRGERRFARGERYHALPKKLRTKTERAFARYVRRLTKAGRPLDDALDVVDMAFRVAGTGSLGCLRVAVLARGKGGLDGGWVFDMKEEGTPAAACIVAPPRLAPADRVCAAIHACLAHPPRMIGTTRLGSSSMFVRRLAPQEDKIALTRLRPDELEPLARHLGALLGDAHRRGAERVPKKAWTAKERSSLLARAIALAGTHEATYLAYCDLVRR